MPQRCKYCQKDEAHAELIGGQHFIVCRAPQGCGENTGDGAGHRPLSNGKKTEAEAWEQARQERTVI